MKDGITISAKELGQLALPNFCPRCFWIKLKVEKKLPFQIFPGIFSAIDSYSKSLVHGWFDRHKNSPLWLRELGNIVDYEEPPHYSKFYVVDKESGVCLRGSPDAIFILDDKTYLIADYKTAKYTETQDKLLPMYEVQLNAYAFIGEQNGVSPVSRLALIYTEPVTDTAAVIRNNHQNESGFLLGFSAHIKQVTLEMDRINPLLVKVREIHELETIPPRKVDCEDCQRLERLIKVTQG